MRDDSHLDVEAELPAVEGWFAVADALLRGLNHALSNRLSSLVMATDEAKTLGRMQSLVTDAERITELLRLYRLLEGSDAERVEAALIQDIVPDALILLSYHPALREVTCVVHGDPDTPPVLVSPSALTQALVLIIYAAARHLPHGFSGIGVALHFSGNADWVEFHAETVMPLAPGQKVEVPELPAIRRLLRGGATGAASQGPGGQARLSLRLPTLESRRKREREG